MYNREYLSPGGIELGSITGEPENLTILPVLNSQWSVDNILPRIYLSLQLNRGMKKITDFQ